MVSDLMTDRSFGYFPGQRYELYDRGTELDVWLKTPNGSARLGVVWPGVFHRTLPNLDGKKCFESSVLSPVKTSC